MAYTRRNYLKTVIRIQAIYLKHKEQDVTNRFIFNRYIEPFYNITEGTFYNYLNVKNPQKQLSKIEAESKNRSKSKAVR